MLCSTTLDLRAHVRHEAESIEEAIALAERALGLDAQSITYTATSGRGAGVVVSREAAGRVQCVYTVICQRLEEEDPQRLVVQNRRLSENLRLHGEIECGDHFVADDEIRFRDERSGDRDALALATREL